MLNLIIYIILNLIIYIILNLIIKELIIIKYKI